jgi:biopolymer transport protein ExbB
VPASLARALVAAARQGQSESMLEITREDETLLGQASHAGLAAAERGREAAVAAVDEAVEHRVGRLFRRVEYLNVIGNVSPMIGLLGTVVGMIQAFNRIDAAGGAVPETSKLVGDIAVALVNTFWGLFIAIPALSAYAMLRNRIDAYAAESVKLCDAMLDLLAGKGDAPRRSGTLAEPLSAAV